MLVHSSTTPIQTLPRPSARNQNLGNFENIMIKNPHLAAFVAFSISIAIGIVTALFTKWITDKFEKEKVQVRATREKCI
jgi:hypothetical protein